jgi:hypothetical protein
MTGQKAHRLTLDQALAWVVPRCEFGFPTASALAESEFNRLSFYVRSPFRSHHRTFRSVA